MLKGLKRWNWVLGQNAKQYPDYIDLEADMLKRKFRQLRKLRTEIDFDNIPEIHAITRTDKDTMRNMRLYKRVAGCVRARDGFPELNIHHPERSLHSIYRDMKYIASGTQPFMLSIDDDSDYFMVTIEDIHMHEFHPAWPMLAMWNRFIPGKPNRMTMRVVIDDYEKSEAKWRGGRIQLIEDYVDVIVYTETWPKVIKVDLNEIVPGKSYTIRDLEKDLPDGIELAPEYKTSKTQALYRIEKTVKSEIYWDYLKHKFDPSSIAELDLALMNLEMKKGVKEEIKIKEESLINKNEDEKLKKLALMLGKDYEVMKKEIIAGRLKKQQEEAILAKKQEKKAPVPSKK